jgi:hypothetical protein
MLMLVPPTIYLIGSLKMSGWQGWRFKEPKLDEILQDVVEEEIIVVVCL